MEEESTVQGVAVPNLSDAIERLMAHPEIIEMAASVLGTSGAAHEPKPAEGVKEKPESKAASPVMLGGLPNLLGLLSGGQRTQEAESACEKHRAPHCPKAVSIAVALPDDRSAC